MHNWNTISLPVKYSNISWCEAISPPQVMIIVQKKDTIMKKKDSVKLIVHEIYDSWMETPLRFGSIWNLGLVRSVAAMKSCKLQN